MRSFLVYEFSKIIILKDEGNDYYYHAQDDFSISNTESLATFLSFGEALVPWCTVQWRF